MLLHDRQISNNDGIKNFFGEIYELYVKVRLAAVLLHACMVCTVV